jgi:pimeloyl-ACP methyl ester carboxylesterase
LIISCSEDIEWSSAIFKHREHPMSNDLPDIGDVTTTKIDGVDIRFARSGKSDGIPVLLTSPWPESIYEFRGVLPAIKVRSPVIAVDLPGFGRSEGRPDLMSPAGMGDFLVKLAAHFRIERMHAVGPDVGTLALLFAAVREPALFVSIIVGSGATSTELAGSGLKDLIGVSD